MKNRKVLAFIMALAMIVTLIPASAFAASTNTVAPAQTVAPGSTVETAIAFKIGDLAQTAPTISALSISLINAEWEDDFENCNVVVDTTATSTNAIAIAYGPSAGNNASGGALATGTSIYTSENTAKLEIQISPAALIVKDGFVTLFFSVLAGDEAGAVKIAVDASGTIFTGGEFTVATVGNGNTSATVLGTTVKSAGRDAAGVTLNTIEISENSINAVSGPQVLRLTLPKGMTWHASTALQGDLGTGIALDTTLGTGTYGSEDLYITTGALSGSGNTKIRSIFITPAVSITSAAKLGDITVTVRNVTSGSSSNRISNASGLIVGKYAEESVSVYTVKEADLPEIIAGRTDDNGSHYEVQVTIEENLASALNTNRYVTLEFPSYVQIASDSAVDIVRNGTTVDTASTGAILTWEKGFGDPTSDTSKFEVNLGTTLATGSKDKFTFVIPVTVDASTPSQDLEVTVSGAKAGIDETTLVVGKIIAPVEVTAKVADIRVGVQKQPLGEIVIKENFVGALRDSTDLDLRLPTGWSWNDSGYAVEVIEGDLEIDEDSIDVIQVGSSGTNRLFTFTVDRESVSKPAEIKISGATVSVDRTPAEGMYKLTVGGNALVENASMNNGNFSGGLVSLDYINVITLADSNLYGEAKFVIGEGEYQVYVNGQLETREMDTAPYIDTANRTQVPVRFAANALGVDDHNIIWDQTSKTVTIFKGDRVVVFTVGSNKVNVNGATINMDTVMVNNGGRTFVPIAHLANALGTAYVWDAAERSVTLLNK